MMRDREHVCIYTCISYTYTQKHARTHGLSYGVTAVGGMLKCGSLSQKHRPLSEGLFFCKRDLYFFGRPTGRSRLKWKLKTCYIGSTKEGGQGKETERKKETSDVDQEFFGHSSYFGRGGYHILGLSLRALA